MIKNRVISKSGRGVQAAICFLSVAILFVGFLSRTPSADAAPVTGAKKVMVLRVHFADYTATSRFSLTQVEGFFSNLNTLWQNTSYSTITINAVVSDLFQLPDNRSLYIDDFPTGDLSNGGKFSKVLNDAIANAPAGLDWADVDAVMVVMAETNASQFHRGQATKCNLPMGPGGTTKFVGCAIFSENPTENNAQVWGRWAHEMGHTFQQSGPAHPSNYNNEFELMDSNYPGQTGVFEKQDHTAFPGWMPGTKYQLLTPPSGGGFAEIWAMEYPPAGLPNIQAVKVEITANFYYLISVRRRILGDDLNGDFTPAGIPAQGVLIERVSEGSDPWVTVIGPGGSGGTCAAPGCNRNALWQECQTYDGGADGVFISIAKKLDDDHFYVRVAYEKQTFQPDVMLNPWTSPPGNTWETTDIWVDSPVNGYGTYRYGMWSDGSGGTVPVGNGDDPVIGQVNRLYARVRNIGFSPATDVVVKWEITDPPGVGIAGANGWAPIGSVDKTTFPGLANIPAGGFVDVYVEWTPNYTVSAADMAAGIFAFHTCVRVKLNPVAGETVLGNQDGDREQENIAYFQAVSPGAPGGSTYKNVIRLRNDDLVNKKMFYLSYSSTLPSDWAVDLNGGQQGVELLPNEMRELPIAIAPGSNQPIGSVYAVDVSASSMRLLQNNLNPKDQHPEFKPLGGVRVESRVLAPDKARCRALRDPDGNIRVSGDFFATPNFGTVLEKYYHPREPWKVLIEGVADGRFLDPTKQVVSVASDGTFQAVLKPGSVQAQQIVCMFAGTTELASSASGYIVPTKLVAGIDLIETAVNNPPAAAVLGVGFTVTDTVFNQGASGSGISTTRYYLSSDTVKSTNDRLLAGSRAVPALASGGSSSGTVTVTAPAGTPAGPYFLLACADDTKGIAESNEGNNCRSSKTIVNVAAPDLVESAVGAPPATAKQGSVFSVKETVQNVGNAVAGLSTTRYYLSLDTLSNRGDLLLAGGRAVPSLKPGAVSTGAASVTVPTTTPSGSYFLLACADDRGAVPESNEMNNCKASSTQIQIP
ncbi:MAG: hypothetical protein HY282_12845 [Nitrospirae bacterium]|nr:hypothetical protein [Candidatus Manganitrophaceae bacterium]